MSIPGPAVPEMRGQMLVSMDGREHLRQRRLISAAFTPRMVARLEEQARRWAVSIVDQALTRGGCNFVQDVAYQLPMHMIADIVGIPVEDRAWLFELTTEFLQAGAAPNSPAEDALTEKQRQQQVTDEEQAAADKDFDAAAGGAPKPAN